MADARPPWDRLPAFNAPVESLFSLSVSSQQVAVGDPMRVAILIAPAGETLGTTTVSFPIPIAYGIIGVNVPLPSITLSTQPITNANAGMVLSPLVNPFILTADRHGPLVTMPWYAAITSFAAINLTVITVSMRDWPEAPTMPSNLIQQTIDGVFNDPARRESGASAAKLYTNRWTQRQENTPYGLSDILKPGFRPFGIPRKP